MQREQMKACCTGLKANGLDDERGPLLAIYKIQVCRKTLVKHNSVHYVRRIIGKREFDTRRNSLSQANDSGDKYPNAILSIASYNK